MLPLTLLVLLGALAPSLAQTGEPSDTAQLSLTFGVDPDSGEVEVSLAVEDPGPLVVLKLDLGRLDSLIGEPTLQGAWKQEGTQSVVDLEATPRASAQWTAQGRIAVQSHSGEGFTSHVNDRFAVLKAGDLMPTVGYQSPQGSNPRFATTFTVDMPAGWTAAGPWEERGEGRFLVESAIPGGFLVAGEDLEEVELGGQGPAYRIVRVDGAVEDAQTERILVAAKGFLGGLYGPSEHQRFIVVAPDPMFRGGLGSPDGVFVHEDSDSSVVAHEMVHAFQRFQVSRQPGEATVWFVEGTAVVHGALLEVAAETRTREDVLDFLEDQHQKARSEHNVDLTTAVYGAGNEPAAYTKGAVVITALNDHIKEATNDEYTLADVLREVNEEGQRQGTTRYLVDTDELLDVIGSVTGYELSPFFDEFVFGSGVPRLGSVFPGQASLRIVGTEPMPAVANEPVSLRVAMSNLDAREITVDEPVLVNGEEAGRLLATLAPGQSAEATATLTPVPKGSYQVQVDRSTYEMTVLSPPEPRANVTVWPASPSADRNVTVGAEISNAGEAPYTSPVRIVLDGAVVAEEQVHVPTGAQRTIARTLAPLSPGDHVVQIQRADGTVLASRAIEVQAHAPAATPGLGTLVALTLLGLAASLAPGHRRKG